VSITVTNVAEQEIQRYDDPYLWGKYLMNVELKPQQEIMVADMLHHPHTVNVQPPRTGKTFSYAFSNLFDAVTSPWEDVRHFAPARYQAQISPREVRHMILRSPVLQAFIAKENGKRQFREHVRLAWRVRRPSTPGEEERRWK
jgi:hypothetical protein